MNIIFTVSGFYSNAADTVAYYKEYAACAGWRDQALSVTGL